jgi:hypothetical protein
LLGLSGFVTLANCWANARIFCELAPSLLSVVQNKSFLVENVNYNINGHSAFVSLIPIAIMEFIAKQRAYYDYDIKVVN